MANKAFYINSEYIKRINKFNFEARHIQKTVGYLNLFTYFNLLSSRKQFSSTSSCDFDGFFTIFHRIFMCIVSHSHGILMG